MATDKYIGQAKLAAQQAHLILKEFAQRLHQLHIHAFRQAADIMVALDCDAWPAGKTDAFDHIGIKRALGEEICPANLARLLLEQVDEGTADKFALLFGIGLSGKAGKEHLFCVNMHQRDVVMPFEEADDLLGLALSHQSVIDKNASKLVADGFMDQHCRHRGINPAR